MEKNHIIISGDRKVNKTSFVMELMEKIHRPKYGFITDMSEVDEKGFHDIYIHRAGVPKDKWCYKEENRIGDCDTRQHNVKTEIFEGLGVDILNEVKMDGVIVLSDLGFMEQNSPEFMEKVLMILESEVPVIAAIKDRHDIPFLDKIRESKRSIVLDVTPENRTKKLMEAEALAGTWKPFVKGKQETEEPALKYELQHRNSCGALVFRINGKGERQVLLVNNGNAKWSFPKGHMEQGETEEMTALREVKEETGADISIILGHRMEVPSLRNGDERSIILFPAEYAGGTLRPCEGETRFLGWFAKDRIDRSVKEEKDRVVIKKAFDFFDNDRGNAGL